MPAAPLHGPIKLPATDSFQAPPIIVVGARTRRQGTGPFIAAGLARAGAEIRGIVGTRAESVELALLELENNWQLRPAGFTDLDTAMEALPDCAVAICSPWQVHALQLQRALTAGRHCLVEKPLAWPATELEVDRLIAAFEERQLLLQVVNQWPASLAAFAELHGEVPQKPEQFTMRLSPISIGPDRVADAAPHFIGMLQALAGRGECENCTSELCPPGNGEQQLSLRCDYEHGGGSIAAELILKTRLERPRPAWYRINELRADREVELPHYRQYLVSGDRRAPLPDPMERVTAEFVRNLKLGGAPDGELLRAAHRNLMQLDAACR